MTTLPHPPIPAAVRDPGLEPMPSAKELARRGIALEAVTPGSPGSPVRLLHRGVCCGVFASPSLAAGTIKRVLISVVLIFLIIAIPARGIAGTNSDLLVSIAVVEDWRGREGAAGEIGPWQMLPSVRAERLRELEAARRVPATEAEMAFAHLYWIKRELRRHGVDPIPFNVALVWNAGLTATITGRAPLRSYAYARRVVADLETQR